MDNTPQNSPHSSKKLRFHLLTLLIGMSFFYWGNMPKMLLAQQEGIKFTNLSHEKGLSNNTIFSMVQDHQGFMWFGTPDGLNKYDGYSFHVLQHDPLDPTSLPTSNAGNLYLDRAGNLWIGTWGGGVIRLDLKTDTSTQYTHDPDNPNSISDNRVQSLFEDSQGHYWFGTYRGGLNKFDPNTQAFKRYQHDPDNPNSLSHNRVWGILEDKGGRLWVATSDGLNYFDPQTETFKHYFHSETDESSLSHSLIRVLHKTKDGVLWIGTEQGVNRYIPQSDSFQHYFENPHLTSGQYGHSIRSILEDHKGMLWIGSRLGLVRFNVQNDDYMPFTHYPENPHSISENNVRSIFEDSSGTMWVGTASHGVDKFDNKPKKFNLVDLNHMDSSNIVALIEDRQGHLWVGSREGGVSRLNIKTGTYTNFVNDPNDSNSLIDNEVWSLFEGKNGAIWIGTQRGLDRFDPETQQFTHFVHSPDNPNSLSNNDVRAIYEDRLGNLWVGTYKNGISMLPSGSDQFVRFTYDAKDPKSLSHREVWSIFGDSQGEVWIGTGDGLNRFDRSTQSFIRYQHNSKNNEFLGHTVFFTYEDRNGIFWIGTELGLSRWDRQSNEFTHFTKKDGLLNPTVKGLLEDQTGNLWLSTNHGLSKFNPETKTFRNYDIDDGLQSKEFNARAYYQTKGGQMFFGGINGLNSFYPDQVNDNPHIPPVVLTGFKKFAKPVKWAKSTSYTEHIDLSYRDSFISFEFTALDYTDPSKNQYAYKLEGFDDNWIDIGNKHEAHFTNLDGGDYIFRVKASNNDNIWNEEGLAISLTITPPPWKTWWAYSAYALIFLGSFFGYIRYKNILHRKELEIQEKELEREHQEAERLEKLNVAYGRFVPHEFLEFLEKQSIEDVQLGDYIKMDMSVLFSDIRAFTTLSEKMTPEENFNFLNSYLKRMEPHIEFHNGFIDKYIGDSIMALFHTCAEDAVDSAIAMQSILSNYNADRSRAGYPPIQIGIGIHTGSLMLGIIGGKNRMEGTVISDAVNLASRVEGMTKLYGANIIVSDSTLGLLDPPEAYLHRELDRVRVKGKHKAVGVYEIFSADVPEVQELKQESGKLIVEGLAHRKQKDWNHAIGAFEEALNIFPEDKAAQFHLQQCQSLRQRVLPDNWDGTISLEHK